MSDAGISTPDRDQWIAALEALLAERDAALAGARADIAARDLLIDMLRVQIARLKRMSFGKSSEKLTREIAQLELALEELETAAAAAVAEDGPRSKAAGLSGILCTGGGLHIRPAWPVRSVHRT